MLKKRVFWAVLLIVAAVVLLIFSGLGIFTLIAGAGKYEDMTQLNAGGKYVRAEINIIYDIFAEETDGSGEVVGAYAVIPYGEEYYMVMYVPEEYLESAYRVYEDTQEYLDGEIESLNNYFVVKGTIRALDEEVSEYYLESVELLSDYALGYVLQVGTVGYLPTVWVIVLTALSGVCLICGVVVLAQDVRLRNVKKEKAIK